MIPNLVVIITAYIVLRALEVGFKAAMRYSKDRHVGNILVSIAAGVTIMIVLSRAAEVLDSSESLRPLLEPFLP